MKPKIIINNSFSNFENLDEKTLATVDTLLTTWNDIEAERLYLLGQIQRLKRDVEDLESRKDQSPKLRKIWGSFRQKLGFMKKRLKDLVATEFVHHLKGTRFPTGHLHIVQDLFKELKLDYEVEDQRRRPEKTWEPILCKDFNEPRYYQKEAHEIAMREGRGVIEASVGSGKTDMLMRLIHDLAVNSLIVVPSKPLLTQWQPLLEAHFGKGRVIRLESKELSKSGLRKLKRKPIRIATIHQLTAARKKGTLTALIEDVDALFVDEIHHSASASFMALMENFSHIYHRFGCSGTFLRADAKTLELWGFLSTVLYRYPAWKAIEDGFLTPVEIITHELEGISKRFYESEFRANYCGGKGKRPEALLKGIQNIFEKYIATEPETEQVLILVNRKDQCGLILHEFLNELGIENTYVSGDSKDEVIADAIRDFNERKIQVLIGSQVLGEGIDLRTADHLIMGQGGKSPIAIVQAAGRLVRLAKGKRIGYLHDFKFSGTKYLEKHYHQRVDIYERNLAPQFSTAT